MQSLIQERWKKYLFGGLSNVSQGSEYNTLLIQFNEAPSQSHINN